MNLLPAHPGRPGRLVGQAGGGRRFPMVWAVLVAVSALAVIGLDVHSLNARRERARTERGRLLVLSEEQTDLEERLSADRERLRQLRTTEGRLARWDEERFVLPELFRALSGALPAGVVLEAVRREGGALRVTGRAGSASLVARTLEALSETERIQDLELLWVEQANPVAGPAEQRFALAGSLRYASREPEPFQRIGVFPRTGGGSR
ncbi:MAG: PilN domain-containing protein [Acidobacteria bacterium]|nr:PilN domain-containing protein [Acidobacteriota bacterium]